MKKINIFLLLLSIFSFCLIFVETNKVKAEGTYTIKITTDAIGTDNSNIDEYYFEANYSANSSIVFTANLYDGLNKIDNSFTYEWKDVSTNVVVCTSGVFELNKLYSTDTKNLLSIDEKTYKLTVKGNSIDQSVDFKVNIIDDVNGQIILTNVSRPLEVNVDGSYKISNKVSTFQLKAVLSKAKVDCTINWYLKTPNSSTFNLYAQDNSSCTITPSELIGSDNGFGLYKFYACAQTSSVLYTSKMIYFEATAGELNSNLNVYTITQKTINNTKSDLEAYTYTLEHAKDDCLDFNKIIWFVNGKKLGTGESFSYEPTTTATYVVTAQYQGANLVELSSIETTPRSTGALKLALYILGGVAIISIIFAISVKVINKKRDVVW